MLFMVSYKLSPETRNVAQDRFKTSGGLPPAGVKMIARYHLADGSGGTAIVETDDASAIARWSNAWTDVLTLEARPVIDDQQLSSVLGG